MLSELGWREVELVQVQVLELVLSVLIRSPVEYLKGPLSCPLEVAVKRKTEPDRAAPKDNTRENKEERGVA